VKTEWTLDMAVGEVASRYTTLVNITRFTDDVNELMGTDNSRKDVLIAAMKHRRVKCAVLGPVRVGKPEYVLHLVFSMAALEASVKSIKEIEERQANG